MPCSKVQIETCPTAGENVSYVEAVPGHEYLPVPQALKDQASHETHAHQGWGVRAFVPAVGEKYVFKPLLSQLLIHTSTIDIIESPHRISGASVMM